MSPDSNASGSACSSVQLNEQIRALWARAGGRPVTAEERAEYERLVVKWAAAMQAEIIEAA